MQPVQTEIYALSIKYTSGFEDLVTKECKNLNYYIVYRLKSYFVHIWIKEHY